MKAMDLNPNNKRQAVLILAFVLAAGIAIWLVYERNSAPSSQSADSIDAIDKKKWEETKANTEAAKRTLAELNGKQAELEAQLAAMRSRTVAAPGSGGAVQGRQTTIDTSELPASSQDREWKSQMARRVLNEARQWDAAIDQWVLENGIRDGQSIDFTAVEKYLRNSRWTGVDALGNPYQIGLVGPGQIKISNRTKVALDGIGVVWGMF